MRLGHRLGRADAAEGQPAARRESRCVLEVSDRGGPAGLVVRLSLRQVGLEPAPLSLVLSAAVVDEMNPGRGLPDGLPGRLVPNGTPGAYRSRAEGRGRAQVDVAGIFLKCETAVSLLEAEVLRPCPCPSPSGRAPRPLCKCVPSTPWGTRVTGELIGHRTRNLRPLSSCIAPYRPLCTSGWPRIHSLPLHRAASNGTMQSSRHSLAPSVAGPREYPSRLFWKCCTAPRTRHAAPTTSRMSSRCDSSRSSGSDSWNGRGNGRVRSRRCGGHGRNGHLAARPSRASGSSRAGS
jgi:hypothetical protein